jgi:hydrogenase maturation protein HypF
VFGDELFNRHKIIDCLEFSTNELTALKRILPSKLNCNVTSSAGRLFDAVAAILNICRKNDFEGQAGMMLESRALRNGSEESYPMDVVTKEHCHILDYSIMIKEMMQDIIRGRNTDLIPAKFHNSLVRGMVDIAGKAGIRNVALSGGCFQNAVLLEKAAAALRKSGHEAYIHHRIPPNDGGISFGQAVAAIKFNNDGNEHVSGHTG